jgi:pimeloyl-ACP methyl ester carboxylesterase
VAGQIDTAGTTGAAPPTPSRPFPNVPGVEHRFVDAGGLRVHVAEAGDPAGEPLVMLHGWPQHWYMWRSVIPLLAPHYRLIMPDLRGHGWTDAPPGPMEKEQLATDLLATMDALGIERTRLMGHDWGGWTSYLAGLRAPDRFEALVTLNIVPPWTAVARPRQLFSMWRLAYQWVVGAPGLGPWVHRDGRLIARALKAQDSEAFSDLEVAAFVAPWREPARAEAGSRLYRTFVARETPAIVRGRYKGADFSVRTLLIHGLSDIVQPPWMLEGLEAAAQDFRVERVPGVGHFIADARPRHVAERALAFFSAG